SDGFVNRSRSPRISRFSSTSPPERRTRRIRSRRTGWRGTRASSTTAGTVFAKSRLFFFKQKTAYEMALEVARVLPPRADVLDVGCGNGFIAHHLQSMLGKTVVGLDVGTNTAA